jgi:hypothetical protein
MKFFLSTSAFVAAVLLLLLAPDRSLTAENNAIATSSSEPIKVLAVKLNTARTNTIESLEIQVQNTSTRPIQYLVIHAEVPAGKYPIRVPVKFGNAPVPNSNAKVELLPPGAQATLIASKNLCERLTKDLAATKRIPSSEEIQTTTNVAIFADRSAWTNGQMNYPDPENGFRWISASEIARTKKLQAEEIFGVKFSKANHKTESAKRTCFRFTGGQLQACCDDLFVMSATFTGDPNGTSQPTPNEACCQPGNCCEYDVSGPCS